jgi:hypothetical protein
MTISYLLLFGWIAFLVSGLLCSEHHVWHSGLSALIAGGLTAAYLYVEHAFKNLTTISSMRDYFVSLLSSFIQSRSLSEESGLLLGEGIWLGIIFAVLVLLSFLILSLFPLAKAPYKGQSKVKKACGSFIYILSWAFVFSFFLAYLSPLFRFEEGFLASVIDFLKVRLV